MSDDPDELANRLFPDAAERWLLTRKRHLKARTYYGYWQNIERLSVFFHSLPLCKIRLGHLRQYQIMRGTNEDNAWPKPCGPSIINHELSMMQSILKRADLWEPFEGKYEALPLPRRRKKKVMSEKEEKHLHALAVTRPSWELAFWTGSITSNTSASGTELRHIQLGHLHLEEEIPFYIIDDDHIKNEWRGRVIALNSTALYYVNKCRIRAKTLGSSEPYHYLFPLRLGPGVWDPTKPASSSWMRRVFEAMRKASGFTWLTPHCFRHQCGTLLFEETDDEMTIQHTMGHISKWQSRDYSHNRLRKQKLILDAIDPTVRLGVQNVDYDPYATSEKNYSMGY